MNRAARRWTDRPFPPYSFVPGHHPHPVSDPAGHMAAEQHVTPEPLQPEQWRASEEFLYGVDLFNSGFYWEAHEAWEALWIVAGRQGEVAEFLKGLIKLAAAGVKAREGVAQGVARHLSRAEALLQSLERPTYCGVGTRRLITQVKRLHEEANRFDSAQPDLLLPLQLELVES